MAAALLMLWSVPRFKSSAAPAQPASCCSDRICEAVDSAGGRVVLQGSSTSLHYLETPDAVRRYRWNANHSTTATERAVQAHKRLSPSDRLRLR